MPEVAVGAGVWFLSFLSLFAVSGGGCFGFGSCDVGSFIASHFSHQAMVNIVTVVNAMAPM